MPYWVGRYRKVHSLADEPVPATASFIQLTPSAASTVTSPDPTPAATTPKQVDSTAERTPPESRVVATTDSLSLEMEVSFPSGVKIHFSSLVPVAYLKELVSVCFR